MQGSAQAGVEEPGRNSLPALGNRRESNSNYRFVAIAIALDATVTLKP